MKWTEILRAPVIPADEKRTKQITFQTTENYLILDIWRGGNNTCRHAINLKTWEYGTYFPDTGIKQATNINSCTDNYERDYWDYRLKEKEWLTPEQIRKLDSLTREKKDWVKDVLQRIERMETDYNAEKREQARNSKEERIRRLMSKCPRPGKKVYDWITEQMVGDLQYAFYDKQKKTCHCTACGGNFPEEAAGIPVKHRKQITCPLCGHTLTVDKRADLLIVATDWLTMIHNVDDKQGVERHFKVKVEWDRYGTRTTELEEHIRLMMLRNTAKNIMKVYYYGSDYWPGWSTGNNSSRRWHSAYLYPDTEGIQAGLHGTAYQVWTDVFPMLAQMGIKAHYNGLMGESNREFTGIAEYMAKGRFYRLLDELSQCITYWGGYSGSTIDVSGESVEEILQIEDKQLINRLRQADGGMCMLRWLQWSDLNKKKLSEQYISWAEKNKIDPDNYLRSEAKQYLTPEQLMNYINRQKKESYPSRTIAGVWNQYEDYLSIAKELGKHMDDALVHRPRELKRRHDEVNAEMELRREEIQRKRNAREAARQAQEMRDKYPGYEDILSEISEKFEYQNDTYCIVVPRDFMEITAEGMALHHCVGNTERYFDRIVSRETYICFLRQQESPDKPFYTIEVEPGGTIRQHRGAYDEEPGIEEIKPFLREWQKVIRKRMSKQDHEYAAQSEILRQKNIEELKAKNNTVVLKGLAEDLMEVI